jgi:hypothetical protein
MTTYETLILINETGNLIGQIMFDVLSVAFAILVAGFVMGKRLNNGMIGVITALSGAWVIPMMMNVKSQFGLMATLAESLTPEQLGEVSNLATYTDSISGLADVGSNAIIIAHVAIYMGSLWFLVYMSRRST